MHMLAHTAPSFLAHERPSIRANGPRAPTTSTLTTTMTLTGVVRACEYREHQYIRTRLLKAPLYIHPRAMCDTRADLPQQLKGELRAGEQADERERWGGEDGREETKTTTTMTKSLVYT